MDLKTGNIRKLYFKFLFPSLLSGLVMSIYSLVDMIVVGQYEGAAGTAALALHRPLLDLILLPECIIRQRWSRLIQCGTWSREKI